MENASTSALTTGDLLGGRYRILRVIGEGGFGRVYLAENVKLQRPCALKVARFPSADQRLEREARLAAVLRGPHVVRVFDVDHTEAGAPYIVMEYLEGQSLAEWLATAGRASARVAVSWGLQICDALEEAHRAGLVHRDIKPSNLFLTRDEHGRSLLKLLDFGLARPVRPGGDQQVTASGLVLGSPAYMSPEQIRNDEVGPASDLWSVGVVLYQLLSGALPFSGSNHAACLAAIVADPPVPLESHVREIDAGLLGVVERCLRKLPTERWPSANSLAEALEEVLERLHPAGARGERQESRPSVETLTTCAVGGGAHPATPRVAASRALKSAVILVGATTLLSVGLYVAGRGRPEVSGVEAGSESSPTKTAGVSAALVASGSSRTDEGRPDPPAPPPQAASTGAGSSGSAAGTVASPAPPVPRLGGKPPRVTSSSSPSSPPAASGPAATPTPTSPPKDPGAQAADRLFLEPDF